MEYPSKQYKDFFERAKLACENTKFEVADKDIIKVKLDIYVHNTRFDLDNAAKPTIDALQKIFDFNDNRIFRIELEKNVIPKTDKEYTKIMLERNLNG